MKLYYLPGACSLASHIALIEAGIAHQAFAVDRQTKRTADGQDFNAFNPKGYVPALVLDDGQVLTETPALLPYIGALNPASKLIPPPGSLGHFRVTEWCVYLSTEVHKALGPIFRPDTPEEQKAKQREIATNRLKLVEAALASQPYVTGADFTVADAYLYVILSWTPRTGLDLSGLPRLADFLARVGQRPAVIAARKDEGLPA